MSISREVRIAAVEALTDWLRSANTAIWYNALYVPITTILASVATSALLWWGAGGVLHDTEDAVDIEQLVSQYIHGTALLRVFFVFLVLPLQTFHLRTLAV